MAASLPFWRVIGGECSPQFDAIARRNLYNLLGGTVLARVLEHFRRSKEAAPRPLSIIITAPPRFD